MTGTPAFICHGRLLSGVLRVAAILADASAQAYQSEEAGRALAAAAPDSTPLVQQAVTSALARWGKTRAAPK